MEWRELLFWILLIIGVILLVWNVFGNPPSEVLTLATLILTVLLKVWTISDRQIKTEARLVNLEKSLLHLASDFKSHINPHKK